MIMGNEESGSPVLSVVVPAYNVEAYLERCIDSIRNQTYRNLEIIIVDDGSRDKTGIIADRYAILDDRIKVIHKENGGIVSARKEGVRAAKGYYLTQVDSDDWIEQSMYEDMIGIMKRERSDLVTSGVIRDYKTGCVDLFDNYPEGNHTRKTREDIFSDKLLFTGNYYEPGIDMHIWNKIFLTDKVKSFQSAIDDEIRIGDDCALVCPYIYTSNKISITHSLYYHYCVHGDSSVGTKKENDLSSLNKLYNHLLLRCGLSFEYAITRYVLYLLLLMLPEVVFSHMSKQGKKILGFDLDEADVILFGAGKFGRSLHESYKDKTNIIAWMDSNEAEDENVLPITDIDKWKGKYDAVLIGAINFPAVKSMLDTLKENGVDSEKVVMLDHDRISKEDVRRILNSHKI